MNRTVLLAVSAAVFSGCGNLCDLGADALCSEDAVQDTTPPTTTTTPTFPTPLVAPLVAVGHGAFFGPDGAEVDATEDLILESQAALVTRLESGIRMGRVAGPDIYATVADPVVANALYVDTLIDLVDPPDRAQLTSINGAMRWHYLLELRGDEPPQGEGWNRGVSDEEADDLEGIGISTFQLIDSSGAEYRQDCADAGVPIPPPVFSDGWVFEGAFDGEEFVATGSIPELWSYDSASPAGSCLALPRYRSAGSDDISIMGLICLGSETGAACFFDSPQGETWDRNDEIDITRFVGGTDLVLNNQGVCSDCHAGENPFVVHPRSTAFDDLPPSTSSSRWHDPLVDARWPQNPGPTTLLAGVDSTSRCDSCHRRGGAGRFPEVSTELPGYCGTILRRAADNPSTRTMPPGGDPARYRAHVDALLASCRTPPGGTEIEVDLPDDDSFLSEPLAIGPLYACAERISVRGGRTGSLVTLVVNGSDIDTREMRNPDGLEFEVPPLVVGDEVWAVQEVDGVTSEPSPTDITVVMDHRTVFGTELPVPTVVPDLIYECAETLAIAHVPGATLTVLVNGGDDVEWRTSTGYTAGFPGRFPFAVDDAFSVRASLCKDESDWSDPSDAVAIAAPASLPAPIIEPMATFEGQQLVDLENLTNGAFTTVLESSAGELGLINWPLSWYPNFDVASPLGRPMQGGDSLLVETRLCEDGPTMEVQSSPTEPCDDLPSPRISTPRVGQRYVTVTRAVPGATIRIYDESDAEIGDGAGVVIRLGRELVPDDVLRVVQQIGECTSATGHEVRVVDEA